MATYKLRPHHLICNLCFRGKGYNPEFVSNFKAIHDTLNSDSKSGQSASIEIVSGHDDICKKCPAKSNDICNHDNEVTAMDDAYLKILHLEIGESLTLKSLQDKVYEFLSMDDFHQTCAKCSWYSLGICAPIIRDMIRIR